MVYNSIAMQFCRLDARLIVVSVEDEDYYRAKLGYVNSSESMKILAMMSRGFFIQYNDFARYSKYEEDAPIKTHKIERLAKKNKFTPLQKMMFCRPIYYDSMFSGKSSITDFRPVVAQQHYPERIKDYSKHFDMSNPVKLIGKIYTPFYKKAQYTEYYLNAPFKSI